MVAAFVIFIIYSLVARTTAVAMPTVVTGYFEMESKHPHSDYQKWMHNLFSMADPMIIYTTSAHSAAIVQMRQERPTRVIITDLQTTALAIKYGQEFWNSQLKRDPERANHKTVSLYWVWHAKPDFLMRAVALNPFGSEFFAWVDIGYFRHSLFNGQRMIQTLPLSLQAGQVLMLDVSSLTQHHCVGGGFIGGYADGIRNWRTKYYKTIDTHKREFIGKDQPWMWKTCDIYPGLCKLVTPGKRHGDPWFYMAPYLMGVARQSNHRLAPQMGQQNGQHEAISCTRVDAWEMLEFINGTQCAVFLSNPRASIALLKVVTAGYKLSPYYTSFDAWKQYALVNGYAFVVYRASDSDWKAAGAPHFSKIAGITRTFKMNYKWVFYTDLDTVVLNPGRRLEMVIETSPRDTALILQNETIICFCLMLWKNTPWAADFLKTWMAIGTKHNCKQHSFDQLAFWGAMMNREPAALKQDNWPVYVKNIHAGHSRRIHFTLIPLHSAPWNEMEIPKSNALVRHTGHQNWNTQQNPLVLSSGFTAQPNDLTSCLTDLAANMPIDKDNQMKAHHWDARTTKWNELDRWAPMALSQPCTIWYIGANTHGRDGVRLQTDYACSIHVFEPVPVFAAALNRNWKSVPRAVIHRYGLGAYTRTVRGVKNAGESTFAMNGSSNDGETLVIKDVRAVFQTLGSKPIDLLHVNCEGCEWELWETLLNAGIVSHIRIIQVGTHWFPQITDIEQRYCEIETRMKLTHSSVFKQAFGWERWVRV